MGWKFLVLSQNQANTPGSTARPRPGAVRTPGALTRSAVAPACRPRVGAVRGPRPRR